MGCLCAFFLSGVVKRPERGIFGTSFGGLWGITWGVSMKIWDAFMSLYENLSITWNVTWGVFEYLFVGVYSGHHSRRLYEKLLGRLFASSLCISMKTCGVSWEIMFNQTQILVCQHTRCDCKLFKSLGSLDFLEF